MLTKAKSSALCQYPSGRQVVVDIGPRLIAHVGGIHRCGSPWSCPICTPVIREGRALEIDLGASIALHDGMGIELLSVTLPHHRRDSLGGRLPEVATALQQILKGNPWKRRRDALGYVGSIRAIDLTWSNRNGWHPHLHALQVFEQPLTEAQRIDYRNWASERWASIVQRKGYGQLHRVHGVDLRPVTSPDDGALKGYLTKIEGNAGRWTAGRELARGDTKTGKGLTPWDLLRTVMDTGEKRYAQLWQEYEEATFGRRALVWSPGLRSRLLGTEDAPTDVELAAHEGDDVETLVRFLVDAQVWLRLQANGTAGDFLTRCELRAAELLEHVETIEPGDPYVIAVEDQ